MLNLIAEQDPNEFIKWEVDYPDNPEEIRIHTFSKYRNENWWNGCNSSIFIIGTTEKNKIR